MSTITKFMVSVGPIHEKDLSDVVKRLEHFPDIRVSTYGASKLTRVNRTTGTRIHKKVTTEGIKQMQNLRDRNLPVTEIQRLSGYSKSTIARYTSEPISRLAQDQELVK